jgi:hypothetical protein
MIRLLGSHDQSRFRSEISQSRIAGRAAQTQGFLKAAGVAADTGFKLKTL